MAIKRNFDTLSLERFEIEMRSPEELNSGRTLHVIL